ncbi:MAG: hypothetical protein IIA63_09460 [Nitrospinae bacterium]|nr:hypothetical protein [Nitrospinota bacterium]MCH7501298.1 hypothetical protein [Nitrospinota bacterium]MCH7651368.1 hypothetical protein [Nitrospinota bacterium]MCZ6540665.1 hypothetical protein [Nitrospinota bacterium]TDJ59700.1 MAG: hypothetical protein E2O42_06075 [Nitrospina sp.]
MFRFQLKPEIRNKMKDPDLFIQGMEKMYWGLIITMAGVVLMLILYINDPEKVLHPTWILFAGLGLCGWGEWQKYKGKGRL